MSKSCKLLFLILISICATYIQAQESAVYNDINFILDPIKGTAEVTATPYISGDVLIPDEITVGQKTYQVVEIGENAFYGCTKLHTVTIGSGLDTVSSYAFYDCKGLKTLNIPENVKTLLMPHVENQKRVVDAANNVDKKLLEEAFAEDPIVKGRITSEEIHVLVEEMLAKTL